jgi:hypothetical protein
MLIQPISASTTGPASASSACSSRRQPNAGGSRGGECITNALWSGALIHGRNQ